MRFVLTFILFHALSCECAARQNDGNVLIDELEHLIKQSMLKIEDQSAEIDTVKSQLSENEANIEMIKSTWKTKRQAAKSVGFTAILSQTLTSLVQHQILKFDSVITNVGNGYSTTTGLFTCPVSGLYEFTSSIVSNGDHLNADVGIFHEGSRISYIHATLFEFDTGSQVVMKYCSQGEAVWIEHIQQHNKHTHQILGGHCSFSGHLISAY